MGGLTPIVFPTAIIGKSGRKAARVPGSRRSDPKSDGAPAVKSKTEDAIMSGNFPDLLAFPFPRGRSSRLTG
jgi:hypothetical protein